MTVNLEVVDNLKTGEDEVIIFDKRLQIHKPKKIFRKYISLGKIPEFDSKHLKSYMFHGSKKSTSEICDWLKQEIDIIKKEDTRYNQFVVNLYETGDNYIEPHSDCDKDMINDYTILIKSFGAVRTLRFTARNDRNLNILGSFEVRLKDGESIELNSFLNKQFRHELLKDDSTNPRISITARMMK